MAGFLNVYTISLFVALAGALFGFDIASVSGVVGTDQYKNFFGNPLGTRQGIITGAMALGSLVGALLSSFVGDRFSRKRSIQAGTILWCIGATLQSASTGVPMLIAGRATAGLCIGLTSALVPIYQSEIAPRKIRGRIIVFQFLAITFGIMIQYFIQYGCSFLKSNASFRAPWAIQATPAAILFIGLFWFPYSPRWLASVDRWDEALRVLAFLRTANTDTNDPLVIAEYREIEDQIRSEREKGSNTFRELFSKKIRKRLFLSMAIQVWSQLAGMNVMMYYTVYLLQSAGIANPRFLASVNYIVNFIMTIPCLVWIDKWGRRPSLLVGSIFMALWFFLIGGLLKRYGQPNPVTNQPYTWIIVGNRAATGAILAFSYCAVGTFAVSWAPISWIYPTEVAPVRVRAKSVALATAANWAANFVLGFAVPPMMRSINWRMYFLFGGFNIAAFIHVLFTLPETKLRTLEEMDEIFEHGEPLWKTFVAKGDTDRLDQLAREIEIGMLDDHPLSISRNFSELFRNFQFPFADFHS
ncbi:general substrate transporter [Lipomyces kononenkoae]|uniref:General substrate transporter n=1 Tax=Lipomyces kononenkoae TaxID=34357 RepID=A0ACC3STH6_LIPKO